MMRDPRVCNVFYAYRGGMTDETQRERQLEDNVTKALVNTLFHTDRAVVAAVLARIGIALGHEAPRYAMQTQRPHRVGKRNKVLLGIVPSGVDPAARVTGTRPSATGQSRPDAWIIGASFSVLVEAKVAGELDAEQMQRHASLLGGGVVEQSLTWGDIYDTLRAVQPSLEGKDRWLVQQFLTYLELINMAGFTGLTHEFFDYFYDPGGDATREEDVFRWVKGVLGGLAAELQPRLATLDPFYAYPDIGPLQKSHAEAWVAFGPGETELRQTSHLTLTLGSTGVSLKVNVELKPAVERLRRSLAADPEVIRGLLRDLSTAEGRFTVVVEERIKRQASQYDYFPRATFDVATLVDPAVGDETFALLCSLVRTIPLPYVMVEAKINRTTDQAGSEGKRGAALLDRLVALATLLHPLVAHIHGA